MLPAHKPEVDQMVPAAVVRAPGPSQFEHPIAQMRRPWNAKAYVSMFQRFLFVLRMLTKTALPMLIWQKCGKSSLESDHREERVQPTRHQDRAGVLVPFA